MSAPNDHQSVARLGFRAVLATLFAMYVVLDVPPAHANDDRAWLEFRPAVVTLKGFIVSKRFYGPPGFGEDPKADRKAGNLLLLLPEPIKVRDPSGTQGEIRDVRQVTVTASRSENGSAISNRLRNYLGREVEVTDALYEGATDWYWATVAMDVETVSLASRSAHRQDPNNGQWADLHTGSGPGRPTR